MKYNTKKKYQIALRRLFATNATSKEMLSLVGTEREPFINHIKKYMISGMTMDNFGPVWGLDHIVPVELFDISNLDERKICYNYNNIMPMFNTDNRNKGMSVHFSLDKLKTLTKNESKEINNINPETDIDKLLVKNEIIQKLIDRCINEIDTTYLKYLNI